jgi:hypothetical protein
MLYGESARGPEDLTSITSLIVVVERLDADAYGLGLTEEGIRNNAAFKLNSAGIRGVLPPLLPVTVLTSTSMCSETRRPLRSNYAKWSNSTLRF